MRLGYKAPNRFLAENGICFLSNKDASTQLLRNLGVLAHHLIWNETNDIRVTHFAPLVQWSGLRDLNIWTDQDIVRGVQLIGQFCRENDHRLVCSMHGLTTDREDYREMHLGLIHFMSEMSDIAEVSIDLTVSVGSPFMKKSESSAIFKDMYSSMSGSAQRLLSITNDPISRGYSAAELGPLARECNVPIVLNLFNHMFNNDSENETDALRTSGMTWDGTGRMPLAIISSRRKVHEDKMAPRLAAAYLLYRDLPTADVDLILDTKSAEAAIFDLRMRMIDD